MVTSAEIKLINIGLFKSRATIIFHKAIAIEIAEHLSHQKYNGAEDRPVLRKLQIVA